jgi:hypothetical protein
MAPSWNGLGGTRHYQEEPCDCRPHASVARDEPETTEITNPIRVGLFGIDDSTNFRVDVSAGGTFDNPNGLLFAGGHRMVVVWDNVNGGSHQITHSLAINMQSDTGLNIKPNGIVPFTLP